MLLVPDAVYVALKICCSILTDLALMALRAKPLIWAGVNCDAEVPICVLYTGFLSGPIFEHFDRWLACLRFRLPGEVGQSKMNRDARNEHHESNDHPIHR